MATLGATKQAAFFGTLLTIKHLPGSTEVNLCLLKHSTQKKFGQWPLCEPLNTQLFLALFWLSNTSEEALKWICAFPSIANKKILSSGHFVSHKKCSSFWHIFDYQTPPRKHWSKFFPFQGYHTKEFSVAAKISSPKNLFFLLYKNSILCHKSFKLDSIKSIFKMGEKYKLLKVLCLSTAIQR